jgi:putative transposase
VLGGLSTRRYPVGLEPVGQQVAQTASATSKSAVSRRFVAMTKTALAELLAADLSGLDLVCLMVDGVHFGGHCCVVALGIGIDGTKHPLALVEGSTENATLVTDLLVGLCERGLNVTQPILCVLDGAKALRRAVLDIFDHPVIARCQLHKLRNVRDKLPQRLRGPVERRMRAAYYAPSALDAEAQLAALARELDKTHPGAAASLREGLEETLTVLRLEVPPTLARTLRSTNAMRACCRSAANTPATSSAGGTARWRCAGAQPGWSRPASSSAASTVTCICPPYAPRSTPRLLELSPVHARIGRWKRPEHHGAVTEVRRNSGHPRDEFGGGQPS